MLEATKENLIVTAVVAGILILMIICSGCKDLDEKLPFDNQTPTDVWTPPENAALEVPGVITQEKELQNLRKQLRETQEEAFKEMDAGFDAYLTSRRQATKEQKENLDIIIRNVLDETQRISDSIKESSGESLFTIKLQARVDLMWVIINLEIQMDGTE